MPEPVVYKNLKRKLPSDTRSTNPEKSSPAQTALQAKKRKLLPIRQCLPIWSRAQDIRDALHAHDILVLSGETGSGKSTQLPQFLLESPWCTGKIAVTQPRRVAAISLARRVAEESGCQVGGRVGYRVRFDECTSKATRVAFVTEGMLLQEMLRDPALREYSCVVVDEVHERSVNVDVILGFLKGLVARRRRKGNGATLKVVVMSATADVEAISRFFEEGLVVPEVDAGVENETKQVDTQELMSNGSTSAEQVARCLVEGRQYPVKVHYLSSPSQDVIDTALQQIFKIHCKEPMPGDMLVFLTGKETIDGLQKLVEEFAQNLTTDYPKLLVLPLYASLPQSAQQRIFERAPPNTRKVILSTNIAETSVTVPGVRFVVDTGKAKITQFRNRIGLESLLVKPISKSSADQRKGRAGREAPGQCFRLFTEKAYHNLEQDTAPEILRCDLSDAVLKMKARGFDDVINFPFLTPPSREAMEKSLLQLLQLGCLGEDGKINEIGRRVARLPLPPTLGRVVLEASRPDRDCIQEVIDIVACFSVEEDIFLPANTEEAREKAEEARSQLRRRQGDHLSLLATVQAYDEEHADRRRWCTDHLVSHRAMQKVVEVRKQLRAQCKQMSLVHLPSSTTPNVTTTPGKISSSSSSSTDEAAQENILKCFLQGYRNNIARLCPDKTYKTFGGNQTVAIHPGSFLFGRKVEAIVYNEFVYTNRAYARGVSAVRLAWLDELLGA